MNNINPPPPPEREPSEREAFEAWWASAGFHNCSEWDAWQARAALAAPRHPETSTGAASEPIIKENGAALSNELFGNSEYLNLIPLREFVEWCVSEQFDSRDLSTRARAALAAPVPADTARIDWLQAQWANGVHAEVCGKGDGTTWHAMRPAASVFVGPSTFEGSTLREAIDAALASVTGSEQERTNGF